MTDAEMVEQHWPHVAALHRMATELTGAPVKVHVAAASVAPGVIDEVHRGLLRKQRQSGSLGLK